MRADTADTARAPGEWRGWRAATREALYGPAGFYRRSEGPAGHFRTSVHASPLFAGAVARLLCRVDEALGRPEDLSFVDMAAGRGELVTGVLAALPAGVASRTRAYAVEIADRPAGLDHRIEWLSGPPTGVTGLLFANEWLDNVPVDVAEVDSAGAVPGVLVGRDGTERLGEPVTGPDADWLARWWPLPPTGERRTAATPRTPGEPRTAEYPRTPGEPRTAEYPRAPGGPRPADELRTTEEPRPAREPGTAGDPRTAEGRGAPTGVQPPEGLRTAEGLRTQEGMRAGIGQRAREGLRAEIGLPRDEAWASAAGTLARGLAVAVDYAHSAHARPPFGTLTGFRAGREVPPVPDGSCDITAHVALDACALPGGRLLPQRTALRALGVTGARPPLALASTDPAAYLRALARAGEAAELTAPGGLGDFLWLLQPIAVGDAAADLFVDVPDDEEH